MTIVQTRQGSLRGTAGVTLFRSIPYAQAERFRPPEPPARWVGERDARAYGPIAPQPPAPWVNAAPTAHRAQDEACLTLCIASPAMPTGAAARTYNILVGENRKVAAALIAVD